MEKKICEECGEPFLAADKHETVCERCEELWIDEEDDE